MTKLNQLRHVNAPSRYSSFADPATAMTQDITCILADWGTTNLRAWAVADDGRVIDQRGQGGGLLAVKDGRFAESFAAFCGDWLDARRPIPAVLSGMVGSKLGWKEAPYLTAPVALADIGRQLCFVEDIRRRFGLDRAGRPPRRPGPAGGHARRGSPDPGGARHARARWRRLPPARDPCQMGDRRGRTPHRLPHLYDRRDLWPAAGRGDHRPADRR